MAAERTIRIVRMVIFLKSAVGWLVFLVGFGKLLFAIKEKSDSADLSQTLTGPMWLFLVSSSLLYVAYSLHIFMCNDIIGHVLHCIIVFFNLFFTSGGVLSFSVCMAYQSKDFGPFIETSLPSPMGMKMVLIGTSISLSMFWIGLGVWPLLSIKRNRYRGYTELRESTRIPDS